MDSEGVATWTAQSHLTTIKHLLERLEEERPTGGRHDPRRRVLMENVFTSAGPKVAVLLLLTIHLNTGEALSFTSGMFHLLDGREGNGSGVLLFGSQRNWAA